MKGIQCSVVPKLDQGGGVGLAILIRRASQEGLQRPEKNFNASFSNLQMPGWEEA